MFRVKVRYTCDGCGWRWVRDFKCPAEVFGLTGTEMAVIVPGFAAPCCREHSD